VIAGVLLVPLPRKIMCSLEVKPLDSVAVFVDVPGQLQRVHIKPGQKVEANEVLADLENIDLRLAIADLERQVSDFQSQLTSLSRLRHTDRRAGAEMMQVQEALVSVQKQIREKNEDLARLQIVSPVAGTVLSPPSRPDETPPEGQLPTWSDSLLNERNLGATATQSELFCEIGDPTRLEAVLIIDQTDIELIREEQKTGQAVEIKLDAFPGRTFKGVISEISEAELKNVDKSLTAQAGGGVNAVTDPKTGQSKPMSTSYTARVPLEGNEELLEIGLRGTAKVHAGYQPLGGRIYRYLLHTFHFWL
jgi:multidrug efflux pump subunit AcrA (membrane-fusion protein)